MSVRVDQRDVLERVQDIAMAAEFELTHEPVSRCDCGATLLAVGVVGGVAGFVCAGCGMAPTYWMDKTSPGAVVREEGESGRGSSLGRSRPLNFAVSWGAVYAAVLVLGFWSVLGWIVGRGL